MHDGTELGGHLKRLQRARDHAPDEVDAELSQEVLLAVGAALDKLPLPKQKIRRPTARLRRTPGRSGGLEQGVGIELVNHLCYAIEVG